MRYPKINSLWKRDLDQKKGGSKGNFIEGDYACSEFSNIKKWLVQEKIDGTNIRINFSNKTSLQPNATVSFDGRNEDSQIPKKLLGYLQSTFTTELLSGIFNETEEVTLYGEGYGPGIQSGGNYRKDTGFILFDVKVGRWWLQQSAVKDIANSLNIPYPPIIGIMDEEEAIAYVKSIPKSLCSIKEQALEGIICRPEPLMLFRDGTPIMMKLKCVDFKDDSKLKEKVNED